MEVPTPSRILITGFSGFMGRYLIEQCQAYYPDARLFGVCRHPPSRITVSDMKDVTLIAADIARPEQMHHAVAQSQPDFVFHLAAQSSVAASWADPASTLRINAGGGVHLLEALRAEHLSARVILVGSGEQYGFVRPEKNPVCEESAFRPINPYGVSKSTQDLYGYQYFVAYALPVLRPVDVPLLVADISHLQAHTGWEPVIDLKYALEQTLNYWRAVIAQNHLMA